MILDPSDFAKSRNVAGFSDADIRSLKWINDRRIVFSVYDATAGGGDQYAPGLFAVDADGGDFRRLVDRNWRGLVSERRSFADKALPWWTFFLAATRERKSDDIFVVQLPRDPRSARPNDERPDAEILRLDTRTQQTTPLSRGAPAGAAQWLLDANDEPRMVVTERDGKIAVHFRPAKDQPWQKLREFDSYIGGEGFFPVQMLADGTSVVRTSLGRDTAALYRFDPKLAQLDRDPMVSIDGFDFNGEALFDEDRQKLLGVHVNGDGVGTVWLDSGYAEIQKIVDSKLPRTVNRLSPPLRRGAAAGAGHDVVGCRAAQLLALQSHRPVADSNRTRRSRNRSESARANRFRALQGTRWFNYPDVCDAATCRRAQEHANRRADPWWAVGTWTYLGLEPRHAVSSVARLRSAGARISGKPRLWVQAFQGGLGPMGPRDAGRRS